MPRFNIFQIPHIKKMVMSGILYGVIEAVFFISITLLIQDNNIAKDFIPNIYHTIGVLVVIKLLGGNIVYKYFANTRFKCIHDVTETLVQSPQIFGSTNQDATLARRLTEDINTFVNVGLNNMIFIIVEASILLIILSYVFLSIPLQISAYLIIGLICLFIMNFLAAFASQYFGTKRRSMEERRLIYTLAAITEPEWIFSSASKLGFQNKFRAIMSQLGFYGSWTLLFQQLPRVVIEALGLGLLAGLMMFLTNNTNNYTNQLENISGILFLAGFRAIPIISKMSVFRQGINMNKAAIDFVHDSFLKVKCDSSQLSNVIGENSTVKAIQSSYVDANVVSHEQCLTILTSLGLATTNLSGFDLHTRYLVSGDSGIGKTRFIKLLNQLKANDIKVTLLPQQPVLLDYQVQYLLNLKDGKYNDLIRDLELERLLYELKIEVDLVTRIQNLSAGETQRLGLAFVLALMPDLILLDEPIANLPDKYRSIVPKLLSDYASQACVIVTSHQRIQLDVDVMLTRLS